MVDFKFFGSTSRLLAEHSENTKPISKRETNTPVALPPGDSHELKDHIVSTLLSSSVHDFNKIIS